MMVSYLMIEWVCETGAYWALHAATVATALAAAAGAAIAWRQWTAAGRRWPDLDRDPMARARFMAVGGLIISILSAVLIVSEGIPNLIVSACQ